MTEAKVTLARLRAELIESLAGTRLSTEDRVRVQGELSVVNAKIKAVNTIEAARLKAAADRRKVAGLTEAQANAARAKAKIDSGDVDINAQLGRNQWASAKAHDESLREERAIWTPEIDPARASAIDDWITVVLQDSGIKVRRNRGGLDFGDVPAKWLVVLQRLHAGILAVARGEELPEDDVAPPKAKKP